MRKVIFSLPLFASLLVSANLERQTDCVEVFQSEISKILYANPNDKNSSIEALTQKINTLLEKDCDLNASVQNTVTPEMNKSQNSKEEKVLILDTTKNSQDCIESFQSEIRELLYENEQQKGNEKKVRIVIKGDGGNCTKESDKK